MGIAEPGESGGAHVLRREGLLSVTGLSEGVCAPMGQGSGPTQPAVWISGAPNVLKGVKQAGRGGEDLSLEAPPDSPGLQSKEGQGRTCPQEMWSCWGGVGGRISIRQEPLGARPTNGHRPVKCSRQGEILAPE